MYDVARVQHPLLLPEFNEHEFFSTDSRQILKYQIFMKIRPVGAELLNADRQDGHKKLTSHFLLYVFFWVIPRRLNSEAG